MPQTLTVPAHRPRDDRGRDIAGLASTAVSTVVTSTERCRSSSSGRCSGMRATTAPTPAARSTGARRSGCSREGLAGLLRHLRAAGQRQRAAGQRHGDVPDRGRRRAVTRTSRSADVAPERVHRRDSRAGRQVVLDRRRLERCRSSPSARCTSATRALRRRARVGRRDRRGDQLVPRRGRDRQPSSTPSSWSATRTPTPATVTFTYLLDTGEAVTRAKTIPANSRLTVNVEAEDPQLRQCRRLDDGDVGRAGDLGARDVLAGGVHHVVRGAQQLRRQRAATKWGLAEGRVGGRRRVRDLHPAGQSEPTQAAQGGDHVPADERRAGREDLHRGADDAVQRARQQPWCRRARSPSR